MLNAFILGFDNVLVEPNCSNKLAVALIPFENTMLPIDGFVNVDNPVVAALAKQMGATYTINSKTDDVHARLSEMTGGFGPDVIIEAVGSPFTYQMAVNEVSFTGRVVCIGYAKADVTFTTKLFVQKELDIRGSRNATPSDFRAVIKYLERGTCPTETLITKVIKPEEALDTMKWWSENPGKVFRILVDFN